MIMRMTIGEVYTTIWFCVFVMVGDITIDDDCFGRLFAGENEIYEKSHKKVDIYISKINRLTRDICWEKKL